MKELDLEKFRLMELHKYISPLICIILYYNIDDNTTINQILIITIFFQTGNINLLNGICSQ